MDYVARQFINLTKKLRRELPKLAELLHRDLKQYSSAIRAAQKHNEQQRDIQPVWLEPILAKYQEPITDKKASDDRHYRVQNSIRWATWCAFIAASIYGAIAGFQWWDFNRSIGLSQIIAKESRVQAAASLKAANAAKSAADTALKGLTLENRAWIVPSYNAGFVPVIPGSGMSEQFRFENIGKSPASQLHGNVVLAFVGVNEPLKFDYSPGHARNFIAEGVVYPRDPRTVTVTAVEIGEHKPRPVVISQQMSDSFQHGQSYVVMHGEMEYSDIFGSLQKHKVSFCSIRSVTTENIPNKILMDCAGHNKVE